MFCSNGCVYNTLVPIDMIIITIFTSEYLFSISEQFLSFNTNNLPLQGIIQPEWIVVPLIFTVATPMGEGIKTVGLFGSPLR